LGRIWRALRKFGHGFSVVQLAIIFGAVYLLVAPAVSLIAAVRGRRHGWVPVDEDVSPEDLRHGS
jgi:hypothetical protein